MRQNRLRTVVSCFFALAIAGSAFGDQRDPLGERADYKVDRSSSRTSSMFTGGSLEAVITEALPDNGNGPAHRTKIDWTLKVQVIGNQSGSRDVKVPDVYFSPEFLDELRIKGTYEGPDFKLKHMGFGDAHNMDGAFYPNCDKILIYDMPNVARANADIDDLEILAHVQYGIPVLGAVKMDIKGKFRGQRIKVGADYKTP